MPDTPEEMEDLDRPATRRDLVALEGATKRDLLALEGATKRDLLALEAATKADLSALQAAMKADLSAFQAAMKADLGEFQAAMKADQLAVETRLRRHFDVVVEAFKTELGSLYDWTHATVSSLDKRVGHLETDHGGRLLGVETRVTRLEKRRK
jgi:hypothetical protein